MDFLITSFAPKINVSCASYLLIFAENFGFPTFFYTSRTVYHTFHVCNLHSVNIHILVCRFIGHTY